MKSDGLLRHVLIAFAIALAFYIASWSWIEHRRSVRGPWELVFRTDPSGHPSLSIRQPALGISQDLQFPDETLPRLNLYHTDFFDHKPAALPFGTLIFQDPTFLPGTVTLNLFGHEVELLPRVLIIDKKESAWGLSTPITIHSQGKHTPLRNLNPNLNPNRFPVPHPRYPVPSVVNIPPKNFSP